MRKNKKQKRFNWWAIFLFFIPILAIVQVFVSHRLATAGKLVGELEKRAVELKGKNQQLEEEINQIGSLSLVLRKAELIGFRPVEKVVYLSSEIPVALSR